MREKRIWKYSWSYGRCDILFVVNVRKVIIRRLPVNHIKNNKLNFKIGYFCRFPLLNKLIKRIFRLKVWRGTFSDLCEGDRRTKVVLFTQDKRIMESEERFHTRGGGNCLLEVRGEVTMCDWSWLNKKWLKDSSLFINQISFLINMCCDFIIIKIMEFHWRLIVELKQ